MRQRRRDQAYAPFPGTGLRSAILPTVNLAPLAMLPHLRELDLVNIEEPSNRAPLARIHHRLQMWLWNINGGTAGPLVKIRRC